MKLNYRRTMLVALAFLSISAFWQAYEAIIPLILRDTFAIGDSVSGVIMAMDNVLALFLLPIFGKLSDRTITPLGKRMPFIVGGTALAVLFTLLMSAASQRGSFVAFIVLLALTLIAMGTYRSPAVALMPDVTPKPLRSKANAIINLMGALGGVYSLIVIKLFSADGSQNYMPLFLAVTILMVVAVLALLIFVKENRLRALVPTDPEEADAPAGGKLPPEMRRSLLLILFSVALWYMGYNAVTTAYSKYFTRMWGDLSGAASCLMIATAGAVVSYIPVGILSTRIGRKRTILIGVAVLALSFGAVALVKEFTAIAYVLFVLIGFAWAAINVNSYPMVVEISRSGDVGKYTGYYYSFSMSAQIITPIVSGWLLEHVGYHTLFPYAFLMVGAAFFTMLFVRHGDSKPARRASAIEHFDTED